MGIAKQIKFNKYTPEYIANMTEKEKVNLSIRIDELRGRYILQLKEVEASDPFYFYQPSNGNVDSKGMDFMKKWLREGDVPRGTLSCQLDIHKSTASIIGASGVIRVGRVSCAL